MLVPKDAIGATTIKKDLRKVSDLCSHSNSKSGKMVGEHEMFCSFGEERLLLGVLRLCFPGAKNSRLCFALRDWLLRLLESY